MARSPNFHRLVLEQMRKVEHGMDKLRQFVIEPSLKLGNRFETARKETDANTIVQALDEVRSPLAGMNRADLFRLARTLEKMLDLAQSVVREMLYFHVESDVFLREMAAAGHEASRYLTRAWQLSSSQPRRSSTHVLQVKKWAREAGRMSREAISSVLKNPNAPEKMKTRGIYRYFYDIAECCDIAADLVGDAVVQAI